MINIERDTSGRVYQIWKQAQMNSCGVACTWMARGIVRQMSINEDEWTLAQRVYRQAINNALAPLGVPPESGPMSIDPNAVPRDQSSMASTLANVGFFARQLARALVAEGLTVEHVGNTGRPHRIVPNKISISKPAIVLLYWTPRGGHFVVVGRATHRLVSYLDPWDGRVNEQPNNGHYRAHYNSRGIVGEVLYLSA
jgi:hypothetical protein